MSDVDNCWQDVGQGLSRASLCNADHVTTTQCDGPPLGLDRRWGLVVLGLDHPHAIVREATLLEGQDGSWRVAAPQGHLVLTSMLFNLFLRTVGSVGVLLVEVLLEWLKLDSLPIWLAKVSAWLLALKTVVDKAAAAVAAIPVAVVASHHGAPHATTTGLGPTTATTPPLLLTPLLTPKVRSGSPVGHPFCFSSPEINEYR